MFFIRFLWTGVQLSSAPPNENQASPDIYYGIGFFFCDIIILGDNMKKNTNVDVMVGYGEHSTFVKAKKGE